MRSCPVRLEQVADPENLREAFLRAAKGKSHRADVIAFRSRLDEELAALSADILSGQVAVGRFTAFTIHEPKERRIHAPCFRERMLHHALVGPCEADFERWHIADTYACRRGKGREAAVRRAEHFAVRHGWFLKLDVEKYFDSIPHDVLLAGLARRFRDARVVDLWRRIIASYAVTPGRGLPIGALTSQYLANHYLMPVDRMVRETLRIPGYVRYMDDMALWGGQGPLREALAALRRLLGEDLGLRIKANWHLQPAARGMDFLGYRILPGGSRLARPSRRRFLRRWAWYERARERGQCSDLQAQRGVGALAAFVRVARLETVLQRLFGRASDLLKSDPGHRAPTASTAVAVGTMTPRIAAPRTATGTRRTTATTTSAFVPPSAHARPSNRAKD